jgi:hypothetical protein
MSILSVDDVVAGMTQRSQPLIVSKASIANQLAGGLCSLWRATGLPAQGAIPGAAAVCSKSLTGAFGWTNPGGSYEAHLARAFLVSGNSGTDVTMVDRLAHMGGLSGALTTSQTVSVDVTGATSNLVARVGGDYGDVQWFVEIYTDIGTTARNLTVTYTRYPGGGGNTGQTVVVALGGASPANRAGRMFPIIGNTTDKIQSIESVQLDLSTGTVGSFGITAVRRLTSVSMGLANAGTVADWAQLGLPRVHDDACLAMVAVCGTTSSGTLQGGLQAIAG